MNIIRMLEKYVLILERDLRRDEELGVLNKSPLKS